MAYDPEVSDAEVTEAARILLAEIERRDRKPFRKVLASLLRCAPDDESIREHARKYPDRWAQALAISAGLSGYERGVFVDLRVIDPARMSDAELLSKDADLGRVLAGEAVRIAEAIAPDPTPSPAGRSPEVSEGDA